ncbi:MAG: sodium:proton antiporter NhaD [Bacteroidetes bacterium]|nr:sodium:proton antiporter NhaD [Bacteroidota bacterium]
MEILILVVFVIGYLAIALEHPININKAASAILTGVLCWSIFILMGHHTPEFINHELLEHLGEIASILFFLLGAMTIVELIDAHDGFDAITGRITTTDKRKLLWIITVLTFFLSAVLDNLTTAIVMTSLSRKLFANKEQRMLVLGMVIIAANAGGAWSPIGDVTTTMLWIGGQITSGNIILKLIIPSIVCALVPLIIISFRFKGNEEKEIQITHLPPFMGILFGLGVLWILTEIIHRKKDDDEKGRYSVVHALRKIDTPSILFFLGILVAVAALQSTGQLKQMAEMLQNAIGNENVIVMTLGVFSAIIDNVPLVAAAMGMYDLSVYPTDHYFWEFLAYCCGTGGSALIIGSAAGVAVMGMEKIEFLWYFKKITVLALLGYFAGAFLYILMEPFFGA